MGDRYDTGKMLLNMAFKFACNIRIRILFLGPIFINMDEL